MLQHKNSDSEKLPTVLGSSDVQYFKPLIQIVVRVLLLTFVVHTFVVHLLTIFLTTE